MTIQTIPLVSIQPPQANPRSVFDCTALEGLAASIRQDGLLQNLVVTRGKGDRYRLVSGERRFRALRLLQKRGEIGADYAVPVEIRSRLTKDEALRLATIENVQRENLPPLDEAKAFAALIRKGSNLDDLAARTGLSPTTIRRRLALNELCDEAKAALVAATINLARAEALTLGGHEAQRGIIEEIERGGDDHSAAAIREHLIDDRPSVAMAVFPLDHYTGTITTDLFAESETSYFDDAPQFLELQRQAVEKLAKAYEGKADWVEITKAYRIPAWQYEEAAEGEQGGVVINLAPSGRVEIREGLAKPDIDPDTRAEAAANPIAPARPKSAYSTPLCRSIAWHKSVAVQAMLLSNPRKAREVAAVERIINLAPHEALRKLATELEPGSAHAAVESQARLFARWLGLTIEEDCGFWEQFPPSCPDELELYEAMQALADHELEQLHTVLDALAFGQVDCERLDTGDSLFNRVARDLGTDMRDHWRPGRSFFERRTREQLAGIAVDCGYAISAGSVRSYKKGELVNALLRHFAGAHAAEEPSPAQAKARQWLPDAMLFPAVSADAPREHGDAGIEDDLADDDGSEEELSDDLAA